MNVTNKLKTCACNRLLAFYKHHANEAKFVMKWKKNGAIHVKCDSARYENESAKKSDAIAKVIVTVVKILKADGCTQDEILEPFKIAVAQEFGITKEEYYRRRNNVYELMAFCLNSTNEYLFEHCTGWRDWKNKPIYEKDKLKMYSNSFTVRNKGGK